MKSHFLYNINFYIIIFLQEFKIYKIIKKIKILKKVFEFYKNEVEWNLYIMENKNFSKKFSKMILIQINTQK